MDCVDKLQLLREVTLSYKKVLVAFSGGSDSALVLKIARDVLGKENVLGVIAKSPSLPAAEFEDAKNIAEEIDASLQVIETNELENYSYASNSINRCYFCKTELYSHMIPLAQKLGYPFILNGTNQDDLGDWRPGLKAAAEYKIKSPLVEAGFTKSEIRETSQSLGLSTWSKPQAACLSSRIPFGTSITPERLSQVEVGEGILKELGFEIVRLRWLQETAVIEVGSDETGTFFQNQHVREESLVRLKALGFQNIQLDLLGYRSGRFNPVQSLDRSLPPVPDLPCRQAGAHAAFEGRKAKLEHSQR